MKTRKIGILGGSFDPIHNGHLAIAESAYHDFDLDEIWFIPAGHSPNKKEENMTSAAIRAKMTELAICDIPYFKMSTIEIDAKETSYTYLTLTKLKEQYPGDEFYFIMGADSLDYFDKWYQPEIICQKAQILVAVRDELDRTDLEKKIHEIQDLFTANISILSVGRVMAASSEIRDAIAIQESVSEFVPERVMQYIKEHGIYQK